MDSYLGTLANTNIKYKMLKGYNNQLKQATTGMRLGVNNDVHISTRTYSSRAVALKPLFTAFWAHRTMCVAAFWETAAE